ncbi:hypothetical protein LINPERHAP1_LOCUS8008, partial [Linum perenne]
KERGFGGWSGEQEPRENRNVGVEVGTENERGAGAPSCWEGRRDARNPRRSSRKLVDGIPLARSLRTMAAVVWSQERRSSSVAPLRFGAAARKLYPFPAAATFPSCSVSLGRGGGD